MLTEKQQIQAFFEDFYSYAPAGSGEIELRMISHVDAPPKRFFRNLASTAAQTAYDLSSPLKKSGVYFGVALRKPGSTEGKKKDVACVTALWCDIDVKKDGNDMGRVLASLKMLELRPSIIINSGNGYHCYWLLREPKLINNEADIEQIETLNAALAEILGGDPSAKDVTRVLRVPLTFNTKGEKPIPVKMAADDWGLDYDFAQITKFITANRGKQLLGSSFVSQSQVKQQSSANKQKASGLKSARMVLRDSGLSDQSLTAEEIWRHTRYGSGHGGAYIGLDEAILRVTAITYAKYGGEWTDETIVQEVLHQVRKIKERDAPNERWDWRQEEKEVADKLERFKPRWEQLIREEANGKKKRTGNKRVGTVRDNGTVSGI